jgi:Fe2+ or Zn2+ uptake regulation protein
VIEEPGDPEILLRSHGLRVTQPRLAVAAVLARARAADEHLTVLEVAERCREILGRVSRQTVYDCLEAMTAAGAVDRVDLPGSPALFESRTGNGHHHHVCRECGALHNVECAVPAPDCLEPELPTGTTVDLTEVVYWGLCASCRRRA